MICQVCGDSPAERHPSKRQRLCPSCAADTPRKIGRDAFDRAYWHGEGDPPPEATKADFYEDYLRSSHTLKSYIATTTTPSLLL